MKFVNLFSGAIVVSSLCTVSAHAQQMGIQQCNSLRGAIVPATQIGLPTQGANVQTATWVLGVPALAGGVATPAYCAVTGIIKSVDPSAPPINFAADFPQNWNKRAVMFGGGGYNGSVPLIGLPFANALNSPSPLQNGFVTFGSDSGHTGSMTDASFALNSEALHNYAGDALKKTRDTVAQLIQATYASAPARWYGIGGSNGGREVLALAQNWPQDWDGVVGWYPAAYIADQFRVYNKWAQVLAAPGGYLSVPKRQVLLDSVLTTCDGLDGVKDGLVSNPDACRAVFNPATALTSVGTPLRCPGGIDAGPGCLSDAQINSVITMTSPTKYAQATNRGYTDFTGVEWGADLGSIDISSLGAAVASLGSYTLGLGSIPPSYAASIDPVARLMMPSSTQFGTDYARYLIAANPLYNFLTFNTYNPGTYQGQVHAMETLLNRDDPNLQPFFQKGGKMILVQGTSDELVPLQSTRRYVASVTSAVPASLVGNGLRYYEVPGLAHVAGVNFTGEWDGLSALQQWAENGTAPVNPVVTDIAHNRTRPLCQYPTWPQYVGGDVNAASSFTCTRS